MTRPFRLLFYKFINNLLFERKLNQAEHEINVNVILDTSSWLEQTQKYARTTLATLQRRLTLKKMVFVNSHLSELNKNSRIMDLKY
jgi:hypothetical protein